MQNRGGLLIFLWIAISAASQAAEIEVRTLGASGGSAKPLCERCADGDYVIRSERLEVAIGGTHRRDESFYKFPTADALGSILFLRPAGTDLRGDIMVGTPYVRVGNTTRHVRYENVQIQRSGSHVTFVANALYHDEQGTSAQFEGRYRFAGNSERVDISLTVTNIGTAPIGNFIYSLFFDPHQVYDFSPSDVEEHRALAFRGYPRENHLIGWVDKTPRLSVTDDRYAWDGGMILPDPLTIDLEPGESDSRKYALITASEGRAVLESLYREVGGAAHTAHFEFESESRDYFEIIVRDADSSAIFFRSFLDRPVPLAVELPAGNYTARANFFPGIAECSLTVVASGENRCRMRDSSTGRVKIRIVDSSGKFVPGKVSFRGLDATPTPYFRTANPTYHDKYWESDKNSVFPKKTGSEIVLPVGSYQISASRGPEFSIDERDVQISEERAEELIFQIDRVIDRPDLVSMDPHLHTLESDGAVEIEEKVRAIIAEGVDVAIATDHNFPVDYRPALEKLGLEDQLVVFAGAEVTVPERLDYNTYPMAVRSEEHNHGAINSLSTDLTALFRASRARDRGVILQINHPRSWQFDYFNWHALDPESAAFALEGFDLSFDVLEVVNGADYDRSDNRAARNDWLNLLRRGYFFPLVGSSDSHEIDRDEPGYSRTYIYSGDSNGTPLNGEMLMERVRKGQSFASNGPILDLTVSGHYRPGDTLTKTDGRVNVGIDVWTAPWFEASAIQLYVNGEPHFGAGPDIDGKQQSAPTRSIPHPTARRLRADIELQLDRDAYLVAEVRGTGDLDPVVKRRPNAGGEATGVFPYALTNPVFVDVDGNGKFDPPLPHEIEIRATGFAGKPPP